jgi:hypothetical protein
MGSEPLWVPGTFHVQYFFWPLVMMNEEKACKKKYLACLHAQVVLAWSLFLMNISHYYSWSCGLSEYNLNSFLNCRVSALLQLCLWPCIVL